MQTLPTSSTLNKLFYSILKVWKVYKTPYVPYRKDSLTFIKCIYISVWIYKKIPAEIEVRFNNFTLEVNKKRLNVAR